MPSAGIKDTRPATPFQQTLFITEFSSFKSIYKCPDAARLKPEISPRTRTKEKVSSTVRFNALETSDTDNSVGWLSPLNREHFISVIGLIYMDLSFFTIVPLIKICYVPLYNNHMRIWEKYEYYNII